MVWIYFKPFMQKSQFTYLRVMQRLPHNFMYFLRNHTFFLCIYAYNVLPCLFLWFLWSGLSDFRCYNQFQTSLAIFLPTLLMSRFTYFLCKFFASIKVFITDTYIPHICHGRHWRRPCKFILAGVTFFFRFNAKNWQFTV